MPTKIESNLEGVAKLLESRRPVPGGSYWLYVLDKKIHLSDNHWPPRCGHRIALLDATDINEGPTPEKWGVINARIKKLKEEGIL